MAQTAPLPAHYDLRALDGHSYIGPVRNQGRFGTCYAFGASAAAESTYNRATGRYDDAVANFSEAFIVWGLGQHYDGIAGINGSLPSMDELQGLVEYGICDEAAFPYRDDTEPSPDEVPWAAPRVKFSGWHRLPAYDVETMKRALSNFGAIDAHVYADDALMGYSGGTFRSDLVAASYPWLDYYLGNHMVAIVGWDDTPPEGGDGVWIVRNSWSRYYGEDGYIRMDYHAARISVGTAYLVYGNWTGDDFQTRLTGEVVASATEAGGIANSYGFYAWGGNHASLVNEASVSASLQRTTGDGLTYGLFLWGGDHASLDNRGSVRSHVLADAGLATAYGLCLQGQTLANSGTVEATAESTGNIRASAYGVRFSSFDSSGTLTNSGTILAHATGPDAWATGALINNAATVVNTGSIVASSTTIATGLSADAVGLVDNRGDIQAWSEGEMSTGLFVYEAALHNRAGGTISAYNDTGDAYGLYAEQSDILNNGIISGHSSGVFHSRLAGTGTFVGNLALGYCRVSPGDGGIGHLTVKGDLNGGSGLTMQLEIGDGGFDSLQVSGTAVLEGDGALEIVPLGYAAAGNYTFISATSASGTFSAISAPPMFSGAVSAGDGGFVLALTRHSYADFSARKELAPLGRALDRVRPRATGGAAAMLNQIDHYAAGAAIGAAVEQLQPAINAGASAVALQGAHRASAQLAAHSQAFPAGGVHGSGSAWFGAFDGSARHGAANGFRALDAESGGGMAGVDFLLGKHYTVGAAFANGSERLNERTSTDRAHIDSDRAFLHARWDERPGSPGWYATARLGLGFSRLETWRYVDFLATRVNGTHRTWDSSLAVGGGRDFNFRRWTVRAFADAEYVCLNERPYTEYGASGAELAFVRRRTESLLAGVGLSVATRFEVRGLALQPEVSVRQAHDFAAGADGLRAAFAGGDTFTAPGRSFPRDRAELGLTLRAQLRDGIAVAAYFTRTDFAGSANYADAVGGQFQAAF